MRNIFLSFTALLAFTACTSTEQKAPEKKKMNLIFILTDEQRFDTSAPYGNDQIKTPNLNQLGKEAVVFENAYVTMPLCSPARASILTGLYPQTNGVTYNNIDLPEKAQTLPEIVKKGHPEYQSAYIGKWHLGNELKPWQGFDTRISTEDGYTSGDTTKFSDYYYYLRAKGYDEGRNEDGYFSRGFAANLPYEESKSKFMETKALEFLEENKENPFILYLGFLEPHSPITGPFNELHKDVNFKLNAAQKTMPGEDAPWRYKILAENTRLDSQKMIRNMRNYWGLVHQVDLSMGVIMQKLKELGLDENTILVYTSEHGNMLGEHHLMYKTVMYDGSSRIPLFVKAPGIESKKISQHVSQVDLVPTLLDLMKTEAPAYLQGKSLVPLMKGETQSNSPVFISWHAKPPHQISGKTPCIEDLTQEKCHHYFYESEIRAVVKGEWKLVVTADTDDKSQLFNLKKDPLELHNLYYKNGYSKKIKELKADLKAWQARTNDTLKITL